MKRYEVIITDDMLIKGVNALSLVEEPATKNIWLTLNKEEELLQLKAIDSEKHILMGVVLIPDVDIPRLGKNGEDDFTIKFSNQTIEKAQELFFKNSFQNSTTIEHNKQPLSDNTVVESWIVEDVEKDKTALYNLNAPIGSWVVKMKINNEEVWTDYVKTGKVKGFSIEGFFKPVEITEMSIEFTDEQKVDKIKELINEL